MYSNLENILRSLLKISKTHSIFFINSGTEAMDITMRNCVEKYSFHISAGAFGKRFLQSALEVGKQPEKFEMDIENIISLAKIEVPKKAELICLTQTDTSVGMAIPVEEIHQLKKKYPDKLIAVDTVASMPYVDLDYSLLDSVFFSVQKGFGLPAGLGVMIVSPHALEKATYLQAKGYDIGTHHNFPTLKTFADKKQTPETPNLLELYLLGKVAKDIEKFGISKLRKATDEKAKRLYRLVERCDGFVPVISNKKYQAPTVVVAKFTKDNFEHLKGWEKETGFIVGEGYGANRTTQIRIANFFAHQESDVEKLA
ncbi:MAG: aminotransferase class V-fold PLP-dependent enzyme, partial [Rhabdochlamydiaceae bacterium]